MNSAPATEKWLQEDFEDNVTRALIALFETKILSNKGVGPNKIRQKHLLKMRQAGLFIPGNDREIIGEQTAGSWEYDLKNDPTPTNGCIAMIRPQITGEYNGYLAIIAYDRIHTQPKRFTARAAGRHYRLSICNAEERGIRGELRYITLTNNGKIVAYDGFATQPALQNKLGFQNKHQIYSQSTHEPHILKETETWASVAMQFKADERFCWTITACEGVAKATLGCTKEEVKSLLYARSLPLTATGRKRPILHLVESHKRRLKNGTEIEIDSFLRGQRIVEIQGTSFRVNPPANLPGL